MSDVNRHLVRVLTCVLAWSLAAAALVGVGSGPAEAKVPRPAGRYTAAIEPLAGYVGQAVCSPGAKPGTTAFANLLLRTYPNSRSLGISRSCGVGGKSEHKEGRAFDWGVSVHSARDRASVNALMTWLLKRDRHGNRYAMARRLGIQYMIWNRRIWGSYAAGSGWRRYTGSSPHTDHVHFSLSWAGARKQTSFWRPRRFPKNSGSAPAAPRPKPVADRPAGSKPPTRHDWPDPRPDERIRRAIPEPTAPRVLPSARALRSEQISVSTRRRTGTLTRGALVAGRRYLIEASGSYRYTRKAASQADAECSTRGGASWWQRDRSLRGDEWYADHLDLYVDGNDLYALADDGESCDGSSHTYRWVYQAERTGRAPFAVWDPDSYRDNRGNLTVRILDLGHVRDTMSWTVPARSKAGVTSPGLLRAGEEYLVTVSGTWKNGRGVVADAECVATSAGWRRDEDAYDMLAGEWGHDSLNPRVEGVRTLPVSGGSECDPRHRYTFVHRSDRSTPLNIRVSDPERHSDNTGSLRVVVAPYVEPSPTPTPSPTPEPDPGSDPDPVPAPDLVEQLRVDSRNAAPVRTVQEFPAGTSLRVTARGRYAMRKSTDWILADAECTMTREDQRWRSTRFVGWFAGSTAPLGDLVVNGEIIGWSPSDGSGSCDSGNHTFTHELTTLGAGPVWFVIADDYYDDNYGALEVEVARR